MGYYFENETQNIHNTIKKLFIYYSHSDPMGTDGQTDKRTNIYSLFRDKLSLPEGSSDWHIPLPELAFVTCACTGIGISEPWFSTSIGTYHYRNWHSKMMPVPVLALLHVVSLPVWA